MGLNAFKFGLACAFAASAIWVVCSFLVLLLPSMMLSMSADMVHMDLSNMGWQLTISGVLIGLAFWFVVASLTGWLIASIYNRLL